jgi:hypothetical protein
MSKKTTRVEVKCPKCDNVFLPSIEEKQSRAGASARRKGHGFERKLAKDFQKWWPGDYTFKRTPMSGGSVLKEGWGLAGDICTTDKDFFWHIEAKNSPSQFTGIHNIWSSKSKFWKWMEQADKDCPIDKVPMLIFNRFDMPTFCACFVDQASRITERLQKANVTYMEYLAPNSVGVAVWLYKDMLISDPECWK